MDHWSFQKLHEAVDYLPLFNISPINTGIIEDCYTTEVSSSSDIIQIQIQIQIQNTLLIPGGKLFLFQCSVQSRNTAWIEKSDEDEDVNKIKY